MKNLKDKFFSILMVLSIMLSAFVVIDNNVAEAADQCIINTASKSLYLRAQAVNGRVLANMPKGATVTRHRVENGWAYVSYNGTYGWCLDRYLRFVRNLDNNNTVQPVSRYANIREGWYRLAPENAPSFAMDVASSGGSGNNVFQYQNYNTNNQKFYIKSVGGGFYSLKAGHADVYLDVWSADGRNGANIQVFAGNNSDAQKFAFMSAGNGAYYIVPKVNTNLVVEVSGGGTDNCKNVQLWTRANVSHHKWKLISTSGPGTTTTINNTFQQYTKTAQRQTKAYTTSSLDSVYGNEWVDKGDVVTVLEETSNAYKVRYPVSNGYKERWVNKNIFTVESVSSPIQPTPIGDVKSKLRYAVFNDSSARITCDFDGYVNTKGRHEGIDMVLYHKAPVYSAISGTVIRTGGDYNTVAIYDSTHDKTVIYLHFNSIAVSNGRYVSKGSLIGYQGSKGASASHVHLEVRNGRKTSAAKSVNDYTLDNPDPYSYWNSVL